MTTTPKPTYFDSPLPLSSEATRAYFSDKSTFFRVDYERSLIKGSVLLTYMTNLNLPMDFYFQEPLSKESYLELMQAYLQQRAVCPSRVLAELMGQVMLWFAGLNTEDLVAQPSYVPEDYVIDFVQAHFEDLFRWKHFLDSMPLFASVKSKALEASAPEDFERIADKTYVGHNIVQLFAVPHFMQQWVLTLQAEGGDIPPAYFEPQFDEYMFGNKHISHYFNHPNNFLALAMAGVASGEVDPANPLAWTQPKKTDGPDPAVPAPAHG